MAISKLRVRHVGARKTVASSLMEHIDYGKNPDKTRGGELVTSYQCQPETAAEEFLVSKQIYECMTNRSRPPAKDVISYLVLQSFRPGEIQPELANKIGYDLAMEFTKGQHQFVVATHIDKEHVHTHIEFNSTTLDCAHKFNNVWNSSLILREISDRLCREHGLAIIDTADGKGKHYAEWKAEKSGASWKSKLRETIDKSLPQHQNFHDFLEALETAGYEIKQGKYISVRAHGQQRFTRTKTLGDNYTKQALKQRIGKPFTASTPRAKKPKLPDKNMNLLIDIQEKINAGKGAGYAQWAKIYNLKEMAKTFNFLSEKGITTYAELEEETARTVGNFNALSTKIKQTEGRMSEVATLKTHIINYSKTRDIYAQYKQAKNKTNFRVEHEAQILLHESAKQAFDTLGTKRIPTVAMLSAEYSALLTNKQSNNSEYLRLKKEALEIKKAKSNIESILNIRNNTKDKKVENEKKK